MFFDLILSKFWFGIGLLIKVLKFNWLVFYWIVELVDCIILLVLLNSWFFGSGFVLRFRGWLLLLIFVLVKVGVLFMRFIVFLVSVIWMLVVGWFD